MKQWQDRVTAILHAEHNTWLATKWCYLPSSFSFSSINIPSSPRVLSQKTHTCLCLKPKLTLHVLCVSTHNSLFLLHDFFLLIAICEKSHIIQDMAQAVPCHWYWTVGRAENLVWRARVHFTVWIRKVNKQICVHSTKTSTAGCSAGLWPGHQVNLNAHSFGQWVIN